MIHRQRRSTGVCRLWRFLRHSPANLPPHRYPELTLKHSATSVGQRVLTSLDAVLPNLQKRATGDHPRPRCDHTAFRERPRAGRDRFRSLTEAAERRAARSLPRRAPRARSPTTTRARCASACRGSRQLPLTNQIRTIESLARKNRITGDRVTPLFTTLQVNIDWFATRGPAAVGTRSRFGESRIYYQYFAGWGWQFHPLANFSQLNAIWTDKSAGAQRGAEPSSPTS